MKDIRFLFAGVIGVAVLALVPSVVSYAFGQPPVRSEAPVLLSELVQAAGQAALESERLGTALLAKLNDEKLPNEDRVSCAFALGKLRYKPAIPRLIHFIMLEGRDNDPLYPLKEDQDLAPLVAAVLNHYPCARALTDYGELALPEVASDYLTFRKEDKRARRDAVLAVVLLSGNTKRTRVYLQGLLMENPDYNSRMKLLQLLPQLQDKNKNKD
jgi:HEAT repeat protein